MYNSIFPITTYLIAISALIVLGVGQHKHMNLHPRKELQAKKLYMNEQTSVMTKHHPSN
jgi:hypothetical protein